MEQPNNEAPASPRGRAAHDGIDRRTMLRRLAATSAVAWVAPQVIATDRASAMAQSGCYVEYNFDDGTLQGWTENGAGGASWQVSSLHAVSGAHSVWFGRAQSADSLHPIPGQPSYRVGNGRSRGTITSPPSSASSTDVVCFQVRLAIENATQYDVFRLFIVQGGTRRELWNKHQGGFTVIDHPENPGAQWDLYTTQGTWVEVNAPIGNPSGIDLSQPVNFEFDFQTVDGAYNRTEGIYLDNIMIPCGTGSSGVAATLGRSLASQSSSGLELSPPLESGFPPGYRPPSEAAAPSEAREAPPE